jgi:hypothetical protein
MLSLCSLFLGPVSAKPANQYFQEQNDACSGQGKSMNGVAKKTLTDKQFILLQLFFASGEYDSLHFRLK